MPGIKQLILLILLSATSLPALPQQGGDKRESGIFYTDVPAQVYNIIAGRPTNESIAFSILANEAISGRLNYGRDPRKLESWSPEIQCPAGQVTVFELNNLLPDKRYYYRFEYTGARSAQTVSPELNFFQTQRSVKSAFTFTIQADSHLDENASPQVYSMTLANMLADSTDFLVDLGDTWMTDKYRNDYKEARKQYIAQRYYFGTLCRSASLFLTLGNHDGESGQQLKKREPENMTRWATSTRKQYFTNPFPSRFYTGNEEQEPGIGFPENYYSWEWGNALFIVLDPFRYTLRNDPWQRTLGDRQYNWLKETLRKSKASFKFVFIHNLVGGADRKGKGRGGAEAARFFEWGGMDTTGINVFAANRPGWEKPIHDLLKEYQVDVVFHGHDHFFAKQDLEGIVYQLVPQPGARRYGNTNTAAEYGYTGGEILNTPGYLRIRVEPDKALVEYVQSSIDNKHTNREVLYRYTLPVKK